MDNKKKRNLKINEMKFLIPTFRKCANLARKVARRIIKNTKRILVQRKQGDSTRSASSFWSELRPV